MEAKAGRVVVFEVNEITWDLIDPLLKRGALPNFKALIDQGVRATPWASEEEGFLEPWVAWTTLYTGVPQKEHRLWMLEQDRETLGAKRLWEYLRDAGVTLGLFGSANSWPPEPLKDGYWIPGPFSHDFAAYPPVLEPIQALNVGLTRGHTVSAAKAPSLKSLVPKLLQLGLKLSTCLYLARKMVEMRLKKRGWEIVSLQPVVNVDFFAQLYPRTRPQFATFHTNHVAYYQHRFWRAMAPEQFEVKPSPEEQAQYGGCIEHGYRVADQVLGRLRQIAGPDANIVVLSGLGAQPATGGRYSHDHEHGNIGLQIKIDKILDLLGIAEQVKYSNLMAPHWKVDFPGDELRARIVRDLEEARNKTQDRPCFDVTVEANSICLSTWRDQELDDVIELRTAAGVQQFKAGDLLDAHAEVPKSGRHHPAGVMIMAGPDVKRGHRVEQCDNLDVAPTLLHLLGQPIPSVMRGRVLEEALAAPVAKPALATA